MPDHANESGLFPVSQVPDPNDLGYIPATGRKKRGRAGEPGGYWAPFCGKASPIWYWFYRPILPNGWYAAICDDSQSFEPAQATRYQVFAVSEDQGKVGGASYPTLQEAKDEALKLAMAQPDVKKRGRK